ncbi:hypothetical protein D7B24_008072 [Verticillium nonalfalfae]|uniref:Secreted protein n=1 Tax=Verticillium nonalfalfae TaxID=1051616 RepID=A0A3M9YJW6_9PEZI|nr:uncharacterized protein D7B24_008072 [Verticillium nonalfalfae]RNJ60381.1 hypothetical protein D7B24_008072 [Verticillium nonalfalfae]
MHLQSTLAFLLTLAVATPALAQCRGAMTKTEIKCLSETTNGKCDESRLTSSLDEFCSRTLTILVQLLHAVLKSHHAPLLSQRQGLESLHYLLAVSGGTFASVPAPHYVHIF